MAARKIIEVNRSNTVGRVLHKTLLSLLLFLAHKNVMEVSKWSVMCYDVILPIT